MSGLTVGRKFEGSGSRKANYLCVSFKAADLLVLEQLRKFAQDSGIPASEVVVDSLRLRFGLSDFELLQLSVLDYYKTKKLTGPSSFETFSDVLEWELKNSSLESIVCKWQITEQQFACLLYIHAMTEVRKRLK